MLIDTHTHLYVTDAFPDGGGSAVERALEAGVGMMIFPAISLREAEAQISLHHRYPDCTRVAHGLHPTELNPSDWRCETDDIFARFADEGSVAVGEIGVDLYWDSTHASEQMDAFGYQLDLAARAGLPVIVHSRNALEETLQVARIMGADCPRLLFHSFTYGAEEAAKVIDALPDAMFGFNGVITFRNADEVRAGAACVGIDRIVSETDSPYLSPVPFRGKTNESSRLPLIVEGIARATGTELQLAEEKLAANASSFFRL